MNLLKAVLVAVILLIVSQPQSFSQTKYPFHKSIISTRVEILYFKHNDSSSLEDQQDTLKIPVVSDKYPRLKKLYLLKILAIRMAWIRLKPISQCVPVVSPVWITKLLTRVRILSR